MSDFYCTQYTSNRIWLCKAVARSSFLPDDILAEPSSVHNRFVLSPPSLSSILNANCERNSFQLRADAHLFAELKVTIEREKSRHPIRSELQMRFSTAVLRSRERYANDAKTDSPKCEKRILGRQGFHYSLGGHGQKELQKIMLQLIPTKHLLKCCSMYIHLIHL